MKSKLSAVLVAVSVVVGLVACGGEEKCPPGTCAQQEQLGEVQQVQDTACRPDTCPPPGGGDVDPPPPTLDVKLAITLRSYTNQPNHARWCQLSYTLPGASEVKVFEGQVDLNETPTTGVVVRLTQPGNVVLSGACKNDAGGWDRRDVNNYVSVSMTCTYYHWPDGAVIQHCA